LRKQGKEECRDTIAEGDTVKNDINTISDIIDNIVQKVKVSRYWHPSLKINWKTTRVRITKDDKVIGFVDIDNEMIHKFSGAVQEKGKKQNIA
jgi:hypothetical protein